MKFKGITIAVPREIMSGERRVAVTPQTVTLLAENGARVLVESTAGKQANHDDEDYRRAGAEIVAEAAAVYEQADILLKVKEPQFNPSLQKHEAEMLKDGGTLVCFLHPANAVNHDTVKMLAARNIAAFTLDGIPRISRAQKMDSLTSMSTIAGYKAVISAANHLPRFIPMMPTAFGVIQPAEFIIVGTGVAGLQAIATARRLGAKVKALDIRPDANEQARSLGAELIKFDVPPELAIGTGGYARRLPEEWYVREREALAPHLRQCDALILSALIPGEEAPILVDEAMVRAMKKGAVIIDIAVDQGGNCALTRCGEEYLEQGVLISGIANIPASLAVDATWMFAQNVWHFLQHIVKDGKVCVDLDDEIIRSTLVTWEKKILHRGTRLAMGLQD